MINSFLGVQPIFDRERQVVAYELLFRDELGGFENRSLDQDCATSQVIVNAFSDIGVERLGRDKLLFLNLTETLLESGLIQTLPPDRVVLEILESARISPALVDAVRQLVGQGFRVALDDFVYDPSWDPLLELCHIVKFDVLGDDEPAIKAKVASLPRARRPQLLAEKIENKFQFVECMTLGFDLFQGYYLARPRVIAGKRPPGDRLRLLSLMARLQDEAIGLKEVEQIISQDVGLSYRLLRILGSVGVSGARPIRDLMQAITLVGLRAIKHWAALIALGSMDSGCSFSVIRSLTRARFCQIVGERHLKSEADALFTVGLFSTLDEMLGIPLAEAIGSLPLEARIKEAILERRGPLGQVLAVAQSFESDGEGEAVTPPAGLELGRLSAYFLEAFAWAQEIQGQMGEPAAV